MKTKDEILAYVKERGCTIPHHLSEYRMQGHPWEFAEFIYALQEHGPYENYMEIGSAASGTTRMFNDFFNFKNIFIIDDNAQAKEYPYRELNLAGLPYVEYIGDSQSEEARAFVEVYDLRFDFVYIDGDHSYEGVSRDLLNYYDLINPGGVIGFHDTVIFPGVKEFIAELKEHFKVQFIGEWYKKMGMALFKKK